MKSKALPCMKFMLLLQHERLASLHAATPRFVILMKIPQSGNEAHAAACMKCAEGA